MTRASNRAATETARSVWEIPAALGRDNPTNRIADGLLCRDVPFGTHHRTVYYFSVGPWRLVEYLWPNCFGRQFPEHRRWIHVLPGEGRVWTPSLYMGVLPLLLAIGSLRFRQGPVRRRWMSWTVLLAVLAALGWHGLGWLVLQGQVALGADPLQPGAIGEPVGGLYWFMTVLLPGYIYFRYPAKLLGVAALALSVLAGWGLDRATAGQARGLRRALLALGVLSLLGVAVAAVLGLWWDDWFRDAAPEVMFGSLDAEGAFNDLLLGFVQTSTVCLLAWWLLRRKNGPKDDSRTAPVGLLRRALPVSTCLLVLVAIDLAVANGWMIASAPAKLWRTPSQAAVAIRADAARRGNHDTIQVWRYPSWTPIFWSWSHSPNRLSHSVRWERATLWPKYNLTERIGVVNVYGTMMSDEHYRLLMHNDPVTVMRATGAKYAILPQGLHLPGGEKLPVELLSASIWYLPDEPAGASATSGQRLGVVETRDLYSERRHLDILLATGAVGSGLGWLVLIGSCVWKRRRHWVRTTARS
ncbi:MAG: hypothetical protein JW818_20360, partial [Pirellulales bacterium]|nr:hypothetical protein [Pirellulales bacterium]